jgi:hypothetical protein
MNGAMITAARSTAPTGRLARCQRAAPLAALVIFSALLGGCAESSIGAYAYSVQGKFDYMNCEQLATQHKALTTSIDDLVALEQKAGRDPGGNIIGRMTYGPKLSQARADRHMLERTLSAKNCPPAPTDQH